MRCEGREEEERRGEERRREEGRTYTTLVQAISYCKPSNASAHHDHLLRCSPHLPLLYSIFLFFFFFVLFDFFSHLMITPKTNIYKRRGRYLLVIMRAGNLGRIWPTRARHY